MFNLMKHPLTFRAILLPWLVALPSPAVASESGVTIWFNQPATNFQQSPPPGIGRIAG